ncbi:MAG: hypothetical protein H8D43_02010 [Chloroflexi bacterium]|nr:hypothetical protein [Chloroflexota bacterium]
MDFDSNESVIIKYGAFTLCYSKLLAHLDEFERPLRHETQLSKEKIWASFDGVLHDLYEAAPESLEKAVKLLADGLRAKQAFVETINPDVANVYAAIIADIKAHSSAWRYRDDVGRWQALGQELAQCFYADSPHTETQERLGREVALDFEWVGKTSKAPFGYRESCLEESEEPAPGTIVVRFSFQDKFINYLAYPFFFLHEYISHVYTVDTGSRLFEDGWLLSAANDFFRIQHVLNTTLGLRSEQADAFEQFILPHLNSDKAKDGYFLAKRFDTWCSIWIPNRFTAITWELAALPPAAGVPHGDFLNGLSSLLERRQDDLLRWLKTAQGCRELWFWFSGI